MDACGICGRIIHSTEKSTWTDEAGRSFSLPSSNEVYCVASDKRRELVVCNLCYQNRNNELKSLSTILQKDIHYQFGLEYREKKEYLDSLISFAKCLALGSTYKVIAECAGVLASMGKLDDALSLAEIAKSMGQSDIYLDKNIEIWKTESRDMS